MLAEAQILLLPLDVIDARENTNVDMIVFWQIIYMSSLFMNTLVIPFAYFFFNTDEDIDHKTRFCTAFRNEVVYLCMFGVVHFTMFVTMRNAYIPIRANSFDFKSMIEPEGGLNENSMLFDKVFLPIDDGRVWKDNDESIFKVSHITLHTTLQHASYCIGAGAFWGQFFLIFFLGSGMITFP